MAEKKDMACPCGSGKVYGECCEPIINGTVKADTAEALMRARYSSYEKNEIDFIIASCAKGEDEENDVDIEETARWAKESSWHGLQILNTEKGLKDDEEGIVEFTATYTTKQGMHEVHKERSYFSKKTGEWLYVAGEIIPVTVFREGEKVGRNDPCPCGSGKKYKKCCGR